MILSIEQKEYIINEFYFANESDEYYPIEDETWEFVDEPTDNAYPYTLLVNGKEYDHFAEWAYREIIDLGELTGEAFKEKYGIC